jgi:hypothetical protein
MKILKLSAATITGILMLTSISVAKEKTYPIEQVEVENNNRGETILIADSVYPTPCYDVSTKTAVVNTFDDTIILKQKSEKSKQNYCNQVITPVSLQYNLGDVPDGKYEVIDSFDDTLIDKVEIRSADRRTIKENVK